MLKIRKQKRLAGKIHQDERNLTGYYLIGVQVRLIRQSFPVERVHNNPMSV